PREVAARAGDAGHRDRVHPQPPGKASRLVTLNLESGLGSRTNGHGGWALRHAVTIARNWGAILSLRRAALRGLRAYRPALRTELGCDRGEPSSQARNRRAARRIPRHGHSQQLGERRERSRALEACERLR